MCTLGSPVCSIHIQKVGEVKESKIWGAEGKARDRKGGTGEGTKDEATKERN